MSPLPTTGTGTAATTSRSRPSRRRTDSGRCACGRARTAHPRRRRPRPAPGRCTLRISSFQPSRSFTVTGMLAHGLLHRFDDAADARGLAAERGADALAREVIDRAAAIEVDEIRAARFDERRRPADLLRIGAGQLHAEERLALELANQRELALAALFQPPRHGHLADRDARAKLDAQAGDREGSSPWSSAPSPRAPVSTSRRSTL